MDYQRKRDGFCVYQPRLYAKGKCVVLALLLITGNGWLMWDKLFTTEDPCVGICYRHVIFSKQPHIAYTRLCFLILRAPCLLLVCACICSIQQHFGNSRIGPRHIVRTLTVTNMNCLAGAPWKVLSDGIAGFDVCSERGYQCLGTFWHLICL